jgi:membrane protease YdiL (CAAX protease family)
MISEKPWRAEAVLLLGAGLLAVLSMGILAAALLKGKEASPDFIGFSLSTVVAQVFALVLIHFFLKAHQMSWRDLLGLRNRRLASIALLAMVLALVASPVTWAISSLVIKIITLLHETPEQQIAVQVLETTKDPAQRLVFALAAIVLAPLVEEILFRGILYPMLKHHGYPRLALWGTSLLFAAVHLHVATFVPLFVFGLILIWIYERTDTLFAPILTHATFNTINFLLFINQAQVEQWLKRFQ